MKIYLFNPETGTYLGEDFADEDAFRRGEYVVPDDATTIPPPKVGRGEAPFFIIHEQRWEIRPRLAQGGSGLGRHDTPEPGAGGDT